MGYVQHKVMTADPDGTFYTLPSNVTVGNHLLLIVPWSYNGCPPSFDDDLGNTYTAKASGDLSAEGALWVFTAPVTTGGACTIELHAACGQLRTGGMIVEVSGLEADPFDQKNAKNNSTSPVDAGSITPTTNGQYILALFCGLGGAPFSGFTAGTGFTERDEWANTAAFEDYIQPTAEAISPDGTVGDVGSGISGYTASFKVAAPSETPKTGSDTFTVSEVAVVSVSATDSVAFSETATPGASLEALDSLVASEEVKVGPEVGDAVVVSEEATSVSLVALDSSTVTEEETTLEVQLTAVDSATVEDLALLLVPKEATDSVGLTESAELAAVFTPSDGVGFTEDSGAVTADLGASDDLALGESGAVGQAGADSVTLSEVADTSAENPVADQVSLSEVADLLALLGVTDSAELAEATTLQTGNDFLGSDSFALSEEAALSVVLDAIDSASVDEQVAISLAATDSITASESLQLGVALEVVDQATVGEVSEQITETAFPVSDDFTLTEVSSTEALIGASDSVGVIEEVSLDNGLSDKLAHDEISFIEEDTTATSEGYEDDYIVSELAEVVQDKAVNDLFTVSEISSALPIVPEPLRTDLVTVSELAVVTVEYQVTDVITGTEVSLLVASLVANDVIVVPAEVGFKNGSLVLWHNGTNFELKPIFRKIELNGQSFFVAAHVSDLTEDGWEEFEE